MSSLHMNQENTEVDDDETKKEIKKVTTATDLQRHKLEKLLKQPVSIWNPMQTFLLMFSNEPNYCIVTATSTSHQVILR